MKLYLRNSTTSHYIKITCQYLKQSFQSVWFFPTNLIHSKTFRMFEEELRPYCIGVIAKVKAQVDFLQQKSYHKIQLGFLCRVGDGDCGSTVKRGALAIQEALKSRLPLNNANPLALSLADSAKNMGGTSGALYNIFFTSAACKNFFPMIPPPPPLFPFPFFSEFDEGPRAWKLFGRMIHIDMLSMGRVVCWEYSSKVEMKGTIKPCEFY